MCACTPGSESLSLIPFATIMASRGSVYPISPLSTIVLCETGPPHRSEMYEMYPSGVQPITVLYVLKCLYSENLSLSSQRRWAFGFTLPFQQEQPLCLGSCEGHGANCLEFRAVKGTELRHSIRCRKFIQVRNTVLTVYTKVAGHFPASHSRPQYPRP